MMRISETVKHLLIINVIMFIGTLAIGEGVLFYDWFAMHFPKNEVFQPWQIITHMFMHGSPTHILFNMFGLWMFGTPVEQVLGSKRFLFIYISAGLGAVAMQTGYSYYEFNSGLNLITEAGFPHSEIMNALSANKNLLATNLADVISVDQLKAFQDAYYTPMVGASGCLMGIMAAFGMMNPNAELMMIFLPIPIKAKYFIPGIILIDLISGIRGQSIFGYGNIAHFAHVGGAITGFLIMWYWKKTQFNRNRWN
ncbi:rhomboid family intramembrane serine protease [Flavivirga abyssicola]|uniref:rhomboid family intramembrane serine protease n=1 Tax=Flavivirga abyssicola TaxID=3063533 RepID=UPI0026DF52FB|nr:rhomboid family intramembrane serine protease [Flavivirga sp. MEBiC07777]WVK13873.1 rhomboid family intramembrane serine protease [Flavivirga sp. MEBiC07777]